MLKIIKAFFILLRYTCYEGFNVFQFYKGETVFFNKTPTSLYSGKPASPRDSNERFQAHFVATA